MIGRIFQALDNAADRMDGSVQSAPVAGAPSGEAPSPAAQAPAQPRQRTPLFTILAGVFFLVSLTSPIILLTMPVMLTLAMAVVAMFRKERPRWLAPIIAVLAILIAFTASAKLDSIGENLRGDSPSTVAAAKLDDWSWQVDPSFAGGRGTIKWTAAVRNTSDRPMSLVKVEFTTYDDNGKILASDFTYINAIAPGMTRTEQSYADYYGSEKTAQAQVVEARFSDTAN